MISFAKKFLSIALALVLLVGVLPMAAFAAVDLPVRFLDGVHGNFLPADTKVTENTQITESQLQGGTIEANKVLIPQGLEVTEWYEDGSDILITAGTVIKRATNLYPGTKPHKHTLGAPTTDISATCTAPGHYTAPCTTPGCTYVEDKEIPATGHKWTDWTVTKKPTATEDGMEKRMCTSCPEFQERVIDKLGPDSVAPDATTQYTIKYYEPDGTYISSWDQTVNAGHVMNSTQLPDDSNAGVKSYVGADKFVGWKYIKSSGSGYATVGEKVNNNLHLQLTVQPKSAPITPPPAASEYTIKYYAPDGSYISSWDQTVNAGHAMNSTQLPDDSNAGVKSYVGADKFVGWKYIKGSGTGYAALNQKVNNDLHLQLIVEPKTVAPAGKVTIKYYAPNGDYISTWDQKVDSGFVMGYAQLPDDSNAGVKKYVGGDEFIGWKYIKNSGVGYATIGEKANNDLHLQMIVRDKSETKPENNGTIHKMYFDFNMAGKKNLGYDVPLYIEDGDRITDGLKAYGYKLPFSSTTQMMVIGWKDEAGNEIYNKTVFNYGRDQHFTAIWQKVATVTVKYYANNNFNTVVEEIQLPFVAIGEDYDVTPDALLKLYNSRYHKATRLDGPYNLEGFRRLEENYRHGDRTNGTVEVIRGVGGLENDGAQTVLYCMVNDASVKPNSKPDNTNPKTGDDNMIFATTAVMLISAGALAVFYMDRKRRNG